MSTSTEGPPLTVIIPTRDRADRLDRCLASLTAVVAPQDRVLVVDSASVDATATATCAAAHGVEVLRLEQPGSSRARNAGWHAATTDLVAFVDDDMQTDVGWADALRAATTRGRFVTGRVEVPDHQHDVDRPVAITTKASSGALEPSARDVLGCSGNMAVHRDDLLGVGGFDERLGPGTWFRAAEDLDLFDRLFDGGVDGWFCHEARTTHDQWRSKPQLIALDWSYGRGAGARIALRVAAGDRRGALAAADELWRAGGVQPLLGDLRRRYRLGVATLLARMAGGVVGLARGLGALRAPWSPALAGRHPDRTP